MAKRRGKGEGSITYRKNRGVYQGLVLLGYNPKTGLPKRKYFYGKTKKEVKEKIHKALGEIHSGTYIEPSRTSVKEQFLTWLENKKPHVTYNTYRNYKLMIEKHIIPFIGNKTLSKLTTQDIQELINEKMNDLNPQGKPLSSRTIKYIYSTINTVLKKAAAERIISFNPAETVEIPKQKKREIKPLTFEEVKKFLNSNKDDPYYAGFLLAIYSGVRLGELLGLRWEDIDFSSPKISVRQQVALEENGERIRPPKTEESIRDIPIPDMVAEELRRHKTEQARHKMSLGPNYQDYDLVFATYLGTPYSPTNYSKYFKRAQKRAGLEGFRFHDLRHTFATLSLQAGIPAKTIQKWLGHTSVVVTLDTYSHLVPEMQVEAMKKVNNLANRILSD